MKHKLYTNTFPHFPLLKKLQAVPSLSEFYLVGGTALSLYLGHRMSYDLDFFSNEEFKTTIIKSINSGYNVITLHDNSIELTIDETKVMFMYFGFPSYKSKIVIDGIKIADPIDIGLMKLLALQGRTTKKDIVDLYFIDKEIIKLKELLSIFEHHYPKDSFNSYQSLKQILHIDDLENQPDPMMLKPCLFEEALTLVQTEVSKHIHKIINS